MKWELKRIDLASLAKVALFLNAILGFIIGIPVGFFIYLSSMLPGWEENPIPRGLAFFFPFILMLVYGIINTITAVLAGLFYNLVGHLFGGLEMEFKETAPKPAASPSAPSRTMDLSSL
jgi:hypothetical protein